MFSNTEFYINYYVAEREWSGTMCKIVVKSWLSPVRLLKQREYKPREVVGSSLVLFEL